MARRLPAAFDQAREAGKTDRDGENREFDTLTRLVADTFPGGAIENYYALIMMDGDNMGAWLEGIDDDKRLPFEQTWHPQILAGVRQKFGNNQELKSYLSSKRPASPARHAAISQALNSFAGVLAPFVVEEMVKGKLLYAGGDDVLAMVSTDDLLKAMVYLRYAYSGQAPEFMNLRQDASSRLRLEKGFALLDDKLMQVMGNKATASIGAVVVHHQTPLSVALRSLREAEKEAKSSGRNAFCLRILKRSGGEVSFTAPWQPSGTFDLLLQLKQHLAEKQELSRRAVYASSDWLVHLPDAGDDRDGKGKEMATALLAQLFQRHQGDPQLARKLVETIWQECAKSTGSGREPKERLSDLLFTAEFLAREARSGKSATPIPSAEEVSK